MNTRSWSLSLLGAALLALASAGLTACGAGSTGSGGESYVAQLPDDGGGALPAPPAGDTSGGAVPPAEPPAEDPPASEPPPVPPPVPPIPPTTPPKDPPAPEPPPPPEPLPSWESQDEVYAVAVDPRDGTRYAVEAHTGRLLMQRTVEPEPMPVGETGLQDVRGLAFDPDHDVFYASVRRDGLDSDIYQLPVAGSPAVLLGPATGYGAVEGLAFHAGRNALFGVDAALGVLLRLDTATGAPTLVGTLGAGHEDVNGLACDAAEDVLYGTELGSGDIVAIDPDTGAARRMAHLVEGPMDGLGYDPNARRFFASSAPQLRLYELDPRGEWIHADQMRGLAYDADRQVLYGSDTSFAILVRIELDSGWKQSLGYLGVPDVEGLTWDALDHVLYGVSSSTRQLYRIDPDTATADSVNVVYGATKAETWNGLAGLAVVDDQLVAVDRDTGALLALSRTDASATLLATIAATTGVESLAFDPNARLLYAYGNDDDTLVAFDVDKAYASSVVAAAGLDVIGGMAFRPDRGDLLGSDLRADAVVEVLPAPPSGMHDEIAALALRFDAGELVGFDLDTESLVRVFGAYQASELLFEHPGMRIQAMAYDPNRDVIYAADESDNSLYEIAPDGTALRLGAAGALGANHVLAMAFDAVSGELWAVDDITGMLLSIDTDDGEAHVVHVAGPPVGFTTIEAMCWDPATGALLAVDRATRSLLEIDPGTGLGAAFATIDPAQVRGMAAVPGTDTLLVIDTDVDQVFVIDRFTGETRPWAP